MAASLPFKIGAGVALGAAIVFSLIVCCIYRRCCRKKVPRSSPSNSSSLSSHPTPSGGTRQRVSSDSDGSQHEGTTESPTQKRKSRSKRHGKGGGVSYDLSSDSDTQDEARAMRAKKRQVDTRSVATKDVELTNVTTASTPTVLTSGMAAPSTSLSFAGLNLGGATPSPLPVASGYAPRRLVLKQKPSLKAADFESKWASLSTVDSVWSCGAPH
jgi:hypothetical protein